MSGGREPAITVSGLRKAFAETTVLDGVDFSVTEGTVFALLGPNGARPASPATTSSSTRTGFVPRLG
jgi:ABC-type branched-subunit amino acid transport system ATPase component